MLTIKNVSDAAMKRIEDTGKEPVAIIFSHQQYHEFLTDPKVQNLLTYRGSRLDGMELFGIPIIVRTPLTYGDVLDLTVEKFDTNK